MIPIILTAVGVLLCAVSTLVSYRKLRRVKDLNRVLHDDNDAHITQVKNLTSQLHKRFTERQQWMPPDPNIPHSVAEIVRQRLLGLIPKLSTEQAETVIEVTGQLDQIIQWCEKVEEDSKPFVPPDGDSMSLPAKQVYLDADLIQKMMTQNYIIPFTQPSKPRKKIVPWDRFHRDVV